MTHTDTQSVNQSISQSLFANVITQVNKKDTRQAVKTGNSPTKLATLREENKRLLS